MTKCKRRLVGFYTSTKGSRKIVRPLMACSPSYRKPKVASNISPSQRAKNYWENNEIQREQRVKEFQDWAKNNGYQLVIDGFLDNEKTICGTVTSNLGIRYYIRAFTDRNGKTVVVRSRKSVGESDANSIKMLTNGKIEKGMKVGQYGDLTAQRSIYFTHEPQYDYHSLKRTQFYHDGTIWGFDLTDVYTNKFLRFLSRNKFFIEATGPKRKGTDETTIYRNPNGILMITEHKFDKTQDTMSLGHVRFEAPKGSKGKLEKILKEFRGSKPAGLENDSGVGVTEYIKEETPFEGGFI